jgi:group I intron endonuclease
MIGGVYFILCRPTMEFYVGSAKNIAGRRLHHRSFLRRGSHANQRLQAAFDRHGEAAFSIGLIESVSDPLLTGAREQFWIKTLAPRLNIANHVDAPFRGRVHSPETIQEMARRRIGEQNPMFGRKLVGAQNGMFGKKMSEATRQRMSKSHMGLTSGMLGKKHSPESKLLMSKAGRGVPKSPEHRAKLTAHCRKIATARRQIRP